MLEVNHIIWLNLYENQPVIFFLSRPAVVRYDLSKLNLKHGKGLRMSGGACEMCGGSMNDKFLFADASL